MSWGISTCCDLVSILEACHLAWPAGEIKEIKWFSAERELSVLGRGGDYHYPGELNKKKRNYVPSPTFPSLYFQACSSELIEDISVLWSLKEKCIIQKHQSSDEKLVTILATETFHRIS